ncbi:hypothetical protein EHS25_005911 [Saitozyma podzolica]|uniref:Acid phosphatase n=1 Tax=Saitozyma podzolica TaxID=1890683 RepID=A0A427XVZ9_9TREE|nr:hypothetical protein EHS25_005911 [Saitozyma podzolica]
MFCTSFAWAAFNFVAAVAAAPAPFTAPFVGGGVYQASDPRLKDYAVASTPPFSPSVYGDYYVWRVDNNTVGVSNATAVEAPLGLTNYGSDNTVYPYFEIEKPCDKPVDFSSEYEGKGTFKKILHILFENEVFSWTMSSPYWRVLATRGKLLTNSHGVSHPSLPNYAAFIAGDTFGMAAENFFNVKGSTIYDLLDHKGIDYATYAEWYTPSNTSRGPCDCNQSPFMGPLDGSNPDWSSPVYRRLDVPALLFSSYTTNYTRCSKIYNATDKFAQDVNDGSLPPYSFYVPDMLHNGHDPASDSDYLHQNDEAGRWLLSFLDLYLPALQEQGTLVVASFDEATWTNDSDAVPNNNNSIVTMLFGSGVTPNTMDDTYITHYGALIGAINNFGLGSLSRNDTNVTNGDLTNLVW